MSETIAEEALRSALLEQCQGGSWEGVVRGVAWQAFSGGAPRHRSIAMLADEAATIFASLIDEALWILERVVAQTWEEFVELRPGDCQGALAAAQLDAREESVRLVESARERVLGTLQGDVRDAA
ncbi:MAG: hypothetical protein ACXVRS_02710 [Gaiellaceae bacterium]